ncbi:MAG: hypothetical protein ACP5LG_06470, partial [Conexivisphaera sp.]
RRGAARGWASAERVAHDRTEAFDGLRGGAGGAGSWAGWSRSAGRRLRVGVRPEVDGAPRATKI